MSKLVVSFTSLAIALSASHVLAAPIEPITPHPEPTPEQICDDVFATKHAALLASGVDLGVATSTVTVVADVWCFKVYQYGRIYSTVLGGGSIHPAVYAPVLAEYASVGYEGGFDRPFGDRASLGGGAYRQQFGAGYVYTHPTYGAHALWNNVAGPWHFNGGRTGRFGWPTTDRSTMPGGLTAGTYYWFQTGYGANTPDLGSWLDFTGPTNEGRATGSVTLFDDAAFGTAGGTFFRSLANETPLVLASALGALNNAATSMTVSMPARTELFLFDGSPLSGCSVSITGANLASVNVANLGAWMDNRTSSMLFVNHGTGSVRRTAAELTDVIEEALDDAVSSGGLVDSLLSGTGASGTIVWTTDTTVQLVPGQRVIRVTRRAFLDIDASCPLWDGGPSVSCNADGEVEFVVGFRPLIHGDFGLHVDMVTGTATSLSCSGLACGKRSEILASLFSGPSAARAAVEDMFNAELEAMFSPLADLASSCTGISVKRVHVLPSYIEVVVADNTTASSCAVTVLTSACTLLGICEELSTDRPAGVVRNSDGTQVTDGVTITPLLPFNPIK